jgi:F-type H+-transporting ATPase subunit delta
MIRIPLNTYAEAYVGAMPKGKDPVGELQRVHAAFNAAPDLASFVASASIDAADRRRAMALAAHDISEETQQFILLLAGNKLLKRLDRIIALVRDASARSKGETTAAVTSAVPLIDRERKDLTKILEQKVGTHISLAERIDPSIGGGLIVQLGDWEFDATVAGRLRRLKHELNTV